jgi:hypothetical protein
MIVAYVLPRLRCIELQRQRCKFYNATDSLAYFEIKNIFLHCRNALAYCYAGVVAVNSKVVGLAAGSFELQLQRDDDGDEPAAARPPLPLIPLCSTSTPSSAGHSTGSSVPLNRFICAAQPVNPCR